MLPKTTVADVKKTRRPGATWLVFNLEDDAASSRTAGADLVPDGLAAVKQAVYFILNTERYKYIVYSWNYGAELEGLFGQPVSFCKAELERRIREALVQDDRITGVSGFLFETQKNTLLCKFTVHTVFGDLTQEYAVN